MSTPGTAPEETTDQARPFHELRETGLLWLINRVVLHPRGFALALQFADDEGRECVGWSLVGDGSEPWQYACDEASQAREDEMFHSVEALLARYCAPGRLSDKQERPPRKDEAIPHRLVT